MAVAIDNARLALDFIPLMQRELDHVTGGGIRFQIHRVCAFATILPCDSELPRQLQASLTLGPSVERWLAKQEALDWQADPDDDLDELEVLHHLSQQAKTVPILSSVISRRDHSNAATTLIGGALSPSFKARTQGRLLSSFHRHSFRQSHFLFYRSKPIPTVRGYVGIGAMGGFLPLVVKNPLTLWNFRLLGPHEKIVWAGPQGNDQLVFWQVQVDVVDLFSRRTLPTSRPGKRWRTAFNQFLQVSDSPFVEDTSRRDRLPHAKRFNGVRYRTDKRTWVAEMKPPKHKKKQDFGNSKSEAEAARAVDAAFHHYGRPDLLNFPDTSQKFLSTRPAAAPGLDEKAKVKFVKEQAKELLAAIAAASPLHSTTGVQTNLETLSSVQISEQGWDWSEDCTLAAPPNAVNPSAYEIQSMWLGSLLRSPPAPMY